MPVKVVVNYSRRKEDDDLKIWIEMLFGLIKYSLDIPYIDFKRLLYLPFLEIKAKIEATGSPSAETEKDILFSWDEINWARLKEQFKFSLGMVDEFEALERGLDTLKDELHRLEELSLRNPILLRIIGTLILSLRGQCEKLLWRTEFGVKDPAWTGILTGVIWALKSNLYSILSNIAESMVRPDFKVIPDFNQVNKIDVEFKSIFSLRLGNIISVGTRIIINRYKGRFKYKWQNIRLRD
ncbi:DUF2953 domain-containing protein [Fuchsiella alkaliacetigena]|nr:DUF2953 domain-containing protein [Fuchsiella alkaliacetigena]